MATVLGLFGEGARGRQRPVRSRVKWTLQGLLKNRETLKRLKRDPQFRLKVAAYLIVLAERNPAPSLRIRNPAPAITDLREIDFADGLFCRFACAEDVSRLAQALELPEIVRTSDRFCASREIALALMLRRMATLNTLNQIKEEFHFCIGKTDSLWLTTLHLIYERWKTKLFHLDVDLISTRLPAYSQAIWHAIKAPEQDRVPPPIFWGFVDGTCRPSARPGHQEVQFFFFNGWKSHHGIKHVAIVTPDGLCLAITPAESIRFNDKLVWRIHQDTMYERISSPIFHQSPVLRPDGTHFSYMLYGDGGFALSDYLMRPYRNPDGIERVINGQMASVRISNEHYFGHVTNLWKFLNDRSRIKLLDGHTAFELYVVSVLLTNLFTCLYPTSSPISGQFNMRPPGVDEYLSSGVQREPESGSE